MQQLTFNECTKPPGGKSRGRKKLEQSEGGNQALVREELNMLCYVCVEPQWSSLHSMRADSDTSQPPFCWNKHHMLSISIQSGSFSRKVWASNKITYFGYIYCLNVNMWSTYYTFEMPMGMYLLPYLSNYQINKHLVHDCLLNNFVKRR